MTFIVNLPTHRHFLLYTGKYIHNSEVKAVIHTSGGYPKRKTFLKNGMDLILKPIVQDLQKLVSAKLTQTCSKYLYVEV